MYRNTKWPEDPKETNTENKETKYLSLELYTQL